MVLPVWSWPIRQNYPINLSHAIVLAPILHLSIKELSIRKDRAKKKGKQKRRYSYYKIVCALHVSNNIFLNTPGCLQHTFLTCAHLRTCTWHILTLIICLIFYALCISYAWIYQLYLEWYPWFILFADNLLNNNSWN